ncbi:hypothetical protein ACFQO4_04685 [Saliphagus sp. GCM10025334]
MGGKQTESCGRCAMSSVVDVVGSDGENTDNDPFGDAGIEVDDATLRRVSPAAWLERVTDRIDDAARRVIYGR